MTGSPAAGAETHVSWVLFAGEHAYKIKKPIRTKFLDFTTVERRLAACRREVELSRRLSPDVYEGVWMLRDECGLLREPVVAMRRMPDEARLARLAAGGAEVRVRKGLLALARRLAEFHAAAGRSTRIDDAASTDELTRRWSANAQEIAPLAETMLDRHVTDEVDRLSRHYLRGRAPLFASRVAAGRIIDGHGDLLADDIFLLEDGPRALDCLEFDDELRFGDGLADAAFLAMDLERLGRHDLASEFLAAYRAAAHDDWPSSLEHWYFAYRAQIRAKVSLLRAAQTGERSAPDAEALVSLALDHLRQGEVRLVLVGGLPGTGKTTVSTLLAKALGWKVLHSDVTRKRLADLEPTERDGTRRGLYTRACTLATYTTLIDQARRRLVMGESVMLDASWADSYARTAARQMAGPVSATVYELRCITQPDEAASRIRLRELRNDDVSDATADVAREMAVRFSPWPEATTIDTTGSPSVAALAAARVIAPERDQP